jgi:hypothetical protein
MLAVVELEMPTGPPVFSDVKFTTPGFKVIASSVERQFLHLLLADEA